MRPDQQDYEGTGITVRVAQGLEVPRMMLLVNKTPASLDADTVKAKVEAAYGCDVVTVMPHSDDLMNLASGGIFVLHYPDHPVTALYETVAEKVSAA
jgi:septum site-determining protein MinD